jgi:branched-chain amino acid transport system permease protein
VARTFQTPSVPEALTVAEVVGLGRLAAGAGSLVRAGLTTPGSRRLEHEDRRAVAGVLQRFGLAELADDRASELPLGTRRMLELARALAAGPSIVLLDEIASGLDGAELERLVAVITLMRNSGMTVVLVEHNFPLVRALADQVVVLAEGQVIASGTPDEVAKDEQVIDHYLGRRSVIAGRADDPGGPS